MRKLAGLLGLVVLVVCIVAAIAVADGSVPQFTFSSDEPGTTFQCSLDGAPATSCSSPLSYSSLAPGQHTVVITSRFTVPKPAPNPPTAAFSFSPTSPTTGQKVTLDGSASVCDPADSCSYYFHDVSSTGTDDWPLIGPGSANSGTFRFQNAGTKYVELVVTDTTTGKTAAVEHNVVVSRPAQAPVPPSNTSLPSVSGTPQSGSQLTAAPGSWSGDAPQTYSYAWSDGQAGQTIKLGDQDVGNNISVTVTATNDAGTAQAKSASVGPVTAAGGGTGGGSGSCDLNATPSNLASQVSAASSGQTICLADGDYGTWDPQTTKALTIRPQAGASPNLSFDLYNTQNLTIDGGHTGYDTGTPGINSTSANWVESSSSHITIKNMAFTCQNSTGACLETLSDGPLTVSGNLFHDMKYPNSTSGAFFAWGGGDPSQTVISYNLFRDMGSDGIDGGTATIVGNDFIDVNSDSTDPRHTDVIQFNSDAVIKGNFVSGGCIQGIDAFDGSTRNTIEDNVITTCSVHSLVTAADNPGSLVDHNTVIGAGGEECGSKTGSPASTTKIQDNVLQQGINWGGVQCTPSVDADNMSWPSFGQIHSGSDFIGTPRFVGGSNPNTYAGYALASGSPGKGAASDGADVGARVNLYPRPAGLP